MLTIKHLIFWGLLATLLQLPHGCWQHLSKPQEKVSAMPDEESQTADEPSPLFSLLSEQARVALIVPCGRCHQSTLDSHKPGAVAIFDLDAGDAWHTNLDEDKLSGLARRAKGNSSLSEEERGQIASFVDQKRAQLQ